MDQNADNAGDDIRVEAYRAVRAHELMLSQTTATFEQAALAPLVLLNGGAVVAFLTLLGALLGKDSGRRPQLVLSAVALGAWGVGLVAAALATRYASRRQAHVSAAQRIMREALEDALYPSDFANILAGPVPGRDVSESLFSHSSAKKYRQDERLRIRHSERERGREDRERMENARLLSVVMFLSGAVLAMGAVLAGENAAKSATRSTSNAAIVVASMANLTTRSDDIVTRAAMGTPRVRGIGKNPPMSCQRSSRLAPGSAREPLDPTSAFHAWRPDACSRILRR